MDGHQTDLLPGEIQFHQWCEPPLEADDYIVKVRQVVDQLKDEPDSRGVYENEFRFSVAGPRFALTPADVYSVYPPKGQTGDFAESLAHVVFARRTLPWERTLTPGARAADDCRPWLAILVFSAADFAAGNAPAGDFPGIQSRPVGELIKPAAAADFVGPVLDLKAYESAQDLCHTVDIPWQLFQAVAPSALDLEYLAHVREVNTGAKETSSLLADGWFSIVIGNRFPQAQIAEGPPVENRAYLVSLEGIQGYLPGSEKSAANKPVRLAVLSSWSFFCNKAHTFQSSMKVLDVDLIGIPRSELPTDAEYDREAKEFVNANFGRGYAALNHSTRLGEKAVSWYRGPLVPLYSSKQTNYVFRPVADAALRYDPMNGMMDVSYAAAFQLGRLLALQDRHFATSLYTYRTGVQRQLNDVLARERLKSVLGESRTAGNRERDLMNSCLKKWRGESKMPGADRGWAAPEPTVADPANLADSLVAPLKVAKDFDLKVPKNICQWLARLMLLYRVPFTYLIPDERMLPPESMRFFYLDPGWLKCLLEGACSVGRASARDELVDKELRDNFLEYAIQESRAVRTRSARNGTADDDSSLIALDQGPSWAQLTGLLLRSSLVAGWQGLEMRAWETWKVEWTDDPDYWKGKGPDARLHAEKDKNDCVLKPLRIDRLGPDILLCIFDGKVDYMEVKQPPEGMHFGAAKSSTDNGYKKTSLRKLSEPSPGAQIDDSETSVVLRSNGDTRVVNIEKSAAAMKKSLKFPAGQPFTSAEFGVEMVQSPGRALFSVPVPTRS